MTSPWATMVIVPVRPGEAPSFERRLEETELGAYCFELLSGGNLPSYLILKPASSFSAAATWQPTFADGSVQSLVTEALRYRKDLTYLPNATNDN